MSEDQLGGEYLVIGRNRREDDDRSEGHEATSRKVMGRKGVGKLAGFGIADVMTVETIQRGMRTTIALNVDALKTGDGDARDVPLEGRIEDVRGTEDNETGTRIILSTLKHKTAVDAVELAEAIGRRFSRLVRGEMDIWVNSALVDDPPLELVFRRPVTVGSFEIETLPDDSQVRYFYGFTQATIKSRQMRGFAIYVNEKTAQAPPFYFDVEGTASGQHATRYVTGEIHADFLDAGSDDESDVVSTDRQEIDWEAESSAVLRVWGERLARNVLKEWVVWRGEQVEEEVKQDSALLERIDHLEATVQGRIWRHVKVLGASSVEEGHVNPLVDAIVRAYEYEHFFDVVQHIELASEADPDKLKELLEHISEWKVMESRAILEIVKGRLKIIDKFHSMILNDSPERAGRYHRESMHDLLAQYPWLINPEWQVLAEEAELSTQLRQWSSQDGHDVERDPERFDFLALGDDSKLVAVDIKRPGATVQYEEVERLLRYGVKLRRGDAGRSVVVALVYGGSLGVDNETEDRFKKTNDLQLLRWSELHGRVKRFYEHYRAVLEGDVLHPSFRLKEREVLQTRHVLATGLQRVGGKKEGLGPQDSSLDD